MNILLIPDKFKGSLTANEVVEALKKGIIQFNAEITIYESVISDGGDGFLEAIAQNDNIEFVEIPAVDPLGKEMVSKYALNIFEKTAYIELANASGLALLSEADRNVLKTSTYGTGLQIKHALSRDVEKIFIGLGGSATNDGGIGIASALGYQFLDGQGKKLHPVGENLSLISKIIEPEKKPNKQIKFYAVNDVNNPLFGDMGAAKVYGIQKGGDYRAIDNLDKGLRNLHGLVQSQFEIDKAHMAGSGAAGGAAYGLNVFLNANFINGIEFILEKNRILDYFNENKIDLIITGEGKIDDQTAFGKLVKGVSELGEKFKVPVIAVCGILSLENVSVSDLGLQEIYQIHDPKQPLAYTMDNASTLITTITSTLLRKYMKT